ncbi:hypothetical protein LCGC14_1147510 [marine sediment metagenome]|uniref:Uncharacterized protein n=1 Tax=marine sediment metagenome TaxID=412755 RepID=A0A0F9LWH4_9ZZZZ|nr:hypothetical protein [Phycisphaerae bacterium]HDZ44731.1 hypothetical protein [Phycisphaerae bacterium]
MAISAATQRSLEIALGNKDKAATICDAIDANTTNAADIAAVSTTTSNATTTQLHTMVKAIVAAAS